MSDSRGKKLVFVGQLFRGDPKNKSWTPVITGQVGVSIQQTSDGWSLVAAKKETVWEMVIGSGFKHRVRDNFVQWQRKCVGGTVETFGLRVKGDADAQQMSEALTKWLSKLEERKKETVVAPPLPSMQPDDVVLKVFIPGRDPTNVCVPQSATVQQVMKSVCQRRELDPTQFLVTLPPNSPGGQPVVCKGHMIIGELSTNEIHLSKRRKSPKRESPTHSENSTKEHLLLLQVELPKGEHTVVRVSPTISMTALLSYICEKRNLPVELHCFDLPATEESLANKTLQELKINSIRVISTATDSGSDQSANSSPSHAKKVKGHTLSLSSLSQDSSQSRRRNAPPPPPPSNQRRRTQPSFMRELTAEVVTRQSHDIKATPISILTTPTGSTEHVDTLGAEPKRETLNREPKRRMTTGSSRRSLKPRNAPAPPPPPTQTTPPPVAKGRPPPVAEKPHKTKTHQESIDEPDFSGPIDEPVLKGSKVIGIKGSEVVGVKGRVREQKERPDLTDSITEGLKKQTATAERRHTGVSRKRMELKETHHMSLDSDAHTPPPLTHTPPLTHPIMVPIEIPDTEDDQLFSDRGKTLPKRRSPAPRPPPSHKSHTLGRTARQTSADINGLSQSRDNLEEIKDENKEKKKTPRSPRKRPSRPAPVPPPASKAIQDQEVQEKILDFKKTPSPPPQPSQESSPSPPPQPSHAPSSPPPQPSHAPSSPPQPSQESSSPQHKRSPGTTQKATAICRDTEDGGKVLIVQPSPSIDRRAKVQAPIIFKLPPPPPQPNRGGNKEKKSVSKDLENNTVPSKEDVEKQNLKLEEIKEVEKIKVEEIKEEEIKKVEEVERPNNDTILSNEYTNLDDSDASEEMTLDFTNERNGDQQNGMDSDSTGTSSDSERGYDITVDDQSDSPNKKSVTNGSYILEDNLNLSINSNSNNSNDSADELGAPPPPPNRNYGDDSADELGAPPPPPNCNYGDDSTDELEVPPPPPPAEFEENTSNSSLDSITELPDLATEQQTTPTKGAGILLLSYKPSAQTKESPTLTEAYKGDSDTSLDAASVEGVRNVECVGAGWTEEPVSPGLSSQLMELDSVVSDLRDLLNVEDYTTSPEATTATVGVVTSTVVPPPPPHVGTPTQSLELPLPVHVEDVVLPPPLEGPSTHSQEIPPPLEESLLPPPTLSQDAPILPPPPSTLSQDAPILPPPPSTLSQDTPILPPPPSTPSQDALIVPPPPSTLSQDTQSPQNQLKRNPIPTKPKPPVVSSRPSNVIKASTVTTTRTQATKSTNELLEKFRERQAKLKAQKSAEALTTLTSSTPAAIPTPNVSIPNNPSAPLGGATGNDAVQAQLAFLQQQVLQQQMLQLQQQFQQLQSLAMQPGSGMGGAGMGMPGMVPGSYLPPGPHNPMMFPGAAPMMLGQSAYQMPPGYMTQQPGMPLYAAQQPTGYNTPPHPAMFPSSQLPPPLLASHPPRDSPPPPLPSQPPPDLPLHTSSPLVLRKVSQETRSMALGGIEDKFDSLMGEVRESDPTVVLKRVSASSHEGRDSPEPTGMAAALEVALRQRRQHFSDHDKRRSIDDSYSSEWQSP